jgi:DNA repair exonuclease SbcCD ATPase subunit
MKVTIKKITLLNFKGIKKLTIEFGDITNIYGNNATGKTTIFDAFMWLLFGKDHTDAEDFNIKTLDGEGNPIHKLEHEVNAILQIDDQEVSLKRVFKEKWVKRRGEEITEFTGHETLLFYNEVPMQVKEYKTKIQELVDEKIFKMITNTGFFNNMKWQDRRKVLIDIAGDIDAEALLNSLINTKNKGAYEGLVNALNSKKNLDEYKKELAAKKTKIKNELELIPARIDEVQRNMPEMPNEVGLNKNIALLEKEIADIDKRIEDKTEITKKALKAEEDKQRKRFEIQEKINGVEYKHRAQIQKEQQNTQSSQSDVGFKIQTSEEKIKSITTRVKNNTLRLENFKNQAEQLRTRWSEKNGEELTFADNQFLCPACKRPFESDDIESKKEEMLKNYNTNKKRILDGINSEGLELAKQIKELENKIKEDETERDAEADNRDTLLKTMVATKEQGEDFKPTSFEDRIAGDEDYKKLKSELDKISNQPAPQKEDVTALKGMRQEHLDDLLAFKTQLSVTTIIANNEKRIVELQQQEKTMSQELASFEQSEFAILNYTKAITDAVTKKVNGLFKYVQFKMFNLLINGGIEENCDCLINGVPYVDANNGARINAGIDIINILCSYYQAFAPIFVDNAESVTTLLPTMSQLIRLVVSEQDKKLRIVNY